MKTYKGYFKPKNPNKYIGDHENIIYRSRWESKFMLYLDNHPDVLKWCSEEFFIPYLSPKDNKVHRYFPDFLVKKQKDGVIETLVIEIKPKAQTMPPKMNGKQTKRMITEAMTYAVNEAKWKAAKEFCADRKYKFIILTEHELGIKF
jgi:hypothetical protein